MIPPHTRRIPWPLVTFLMTFVVAPVLTFAFVIYDVEPWHSLYVFLDPGAPPAVGDYVFLGTPTVFLGFALVFAGERAEEIAHTVGARMRQRWRDRTASQHR